MRVIAIKCAPFWIVLISDSTVRRHTDKNIDRENSPNQIISYIIWEEFCAGQNFIVIYTVWIREEDVTYIVQFVNKLITYRIIGDYIYEMVSL